MMQKQRDVLENSIVFLKIQQIMQISLIYLQKYMNIEAATAGVL